MEILKVIKVGGNIINDSNALSHFLIEFSKLEGKKILVHGGGKIATTLANKIGVVSKFVEGRRITSKETLDVVTMAYAGKVNKNIVAILQQNSCNAIGLSGSDGNTIKAIKRPVKKIDYGYVGDVKEVNNEVLNLLLNTQIIPVFCAITHDKNGQLLNTNADTIASELAISFSKIYKTELYYCFEKKGVLYDINDDNSVLENINRIKYQSLKEKKIITEGMLPKLDNCFHALTKEVFKVCIGQPEMLFNLKSKFTTLQQ